MWRARDAGYRDPAAVRLYVLLMFALDPRFDERARFRQYLESASGSLDERLLKMPAWSHPNISLLDSAAMAGFGLYIAFWATACMVALALFLAHRERHVISRRAYWQFLTEPWKVATFVIGASLITLIAPHTGDPTWDYFDGFFMSVFCYTTAPWVVGVLYRVRRREARAEEVYVAVCAWLFSASWSYDIYQLWRWGFYPITWFSNLFASSIIYLCAGLFWNLEYVPGRGVIFSFMREGWPSRAPASSFWKVALWAAVFAVPAVAAILVFML